jgi:hypothetical protein
VIGKLVTLSEREAEELSRRRCGRDRPIERETRPVGVARPRSAHANDLALSRAEARELAELLKSGGFRTDLALLQEALREALEDAPP